MRISAQIAIVISVIFSLVCFGVAFQGFRALGGITDPTQLADAKGFAWFWAFLGAVGIVSGLLSLWIVRTDGVERDA